MQLSMKDKSYILKKGGHVRHHLTVAGVISLLSVLCVGSAESKAQTPPPTPVLTEQEAVAIAKTANRQTKKASLDIDRAAKSIWEAKTGYFPQSSAKVTSGYPLSTFSYTIPKGTLGNYPATGPIPATGSTITTSLWQTRSASPITGSAFCRPSWRQTLGSRRLWRRHFAPWIITLRRVLNWPQTSAPGFA